MADGLEPAEHQRDIEPWDLHLCQEATAADLDRHVMREVLQRMGLFRAERGVEIYLQADRRLSPDAPPLCAPDPRTGVLRPRNFAVLLFAREPQRFLHGAISTFSADPGRDPSESVAKRSEITGSLLEQTLRLQPLLEAEVVTLFDKIDLGHPNVLKYPARALQEAKINALAHRDYSLPEPTRMNSFRDRIEFVSPGSLPVGIQIEDLERGEVTPRWRNPSLAWFLSRLQLAQADAQGVSIMRRTMEALGWPPPRFEVMEGRVRCTLCAQPRALELEAKLGRSFLGRSS